MIASSIKAEVVKANARKVGDTGRDLGCIRDTDIEIVGRSEERRARAIEIHRSSD